MLQLNRILFPTDFSDNAENALSFALELASQTGAAITLFHVIEAPSYIPHDSGGLPKSHSQKARTLLEKTADSIRKSERYSELQVDLVLQNGNVVSSILEHANSKDFDLVVMGTKGRSKMNRILYGSIASHVILESSIPVLAIPENSTQATFDPMTFATDFRSGDWAALKQTIEWADTFNADLNVLHVAADRDMQTEIKFRGFRDLVREKTGNRDRPIQFDIVIQKEFLAGVADYLTDHRMGLLVLVRYKKKRIEALLKKDHTKELSYYTKVPLLVLNE
ncbi:universal stress protein [Halalkalibaculum sp. DA3122]|uniref:universal stress protein n=1 Tax=unclassified Halalkalibaculum TaxID=2964617 RepID=UPI00375430CD